jgi:hypothetical protein
MKDRRFRSLRDGIVGITDTITIKMMMIVVKDLVVTLIEIRVVPISVATSTAIKAVPIINGDKLIGNKATEIGVEMSTVIKAVPIINRDKLIASKATAIGVGETIVIRVVLTNKIINSDKGLDSVLVAAIPVM